MIYMWSKKLWQCSVSSHPWASALHRCRAAATEHPLPQQHQTMQEERVYQWSCPLRHGRQRQIGRRKEEKKTEFSYLWCLVCVLLTIHADSCICFGVLFQKKALLELLWQLARFIIAAKTHSRAMMWRSSYTKGNRYNTRQKRMPLESGRGKKGTNGSKQNQEK